MVEYDAEVPPAEEVPSEYDTVTYAYSLANAKGFIEFRDKENNVIKRIGDKSIAVEGLTHKTVGAFPNIRLSARKEDVANIIITRTTIVIQGRKTG